MPLNLGLAGLALVEGRLDDARTRAGLVCEAAAQCGERSWLALGSLTLAETLSRSGAIDASRSALDTACNLAASGQLPAAALRVWTRASRLATTHGDAACAARCQTELERLAAPPRPELCPRQPARPELRRCEPRPAGSRTSVIRLVFVRRVRLQPDRDSVCGVRRVRLQPDREVVVR